MISNTNDYELDIDELLKFEEEVLIPAVERTKIEYLEGKTGRYCRYCSGRYLCVKRGDEFMETYEKLKQPVSSMSDETIEELLPTIDEFIRYAEDLKTMAVKRALNGHKWTGLKLVHSRVTRKIMNEAGVIKACEDIGIDPYVSQKVAGITELTKRIGKDKVNSLIGPYITLQTGNIILVPTTDPREEVVILEEIGVPDGEI